MSWNNTQLLDGLRAKDPAVFSYLYRRYGPMIKSHVLKNSGMAEDAQEIIQLTMLKLWMAVRDHRYEETGKLDAYLYQVAANTWKAELRRRRTQPEADFTEAAFGVVDESEDALAEAIVKEQQLQNLHLALQELAEPCQSIIRAYHLRKVSLQDLATEMAYDYNNLRKRIFDCRSKLRKLVERLGGAKL